VTKLVTKDEFDRWNDDYGETLFILWKINFI